MSGHSLYHIDLVHIRFYLQRARPLSDGWVDGMDGWMITRFFPVQLRVREPMVGGATSVAFAVEVGR